MTLSSVQPKKPIAINKFLVHLDQELGEGAEGIVVKASALNAGIAACKITQHSTCESQKNKPESIYVERERRNLKEFGQLLDQYTNVEGDFVTNYTFMPFHEGISLTEHLYSIEKILHPKRHIICLQKREHTPLHLFNLAIDLIRMMHNGHKKGFVFRDFRMDNILIHKKSENPDDYTLAYVDHGSLLTFEEARIIKTLDGTTNGYSAPELDVDKKENIPPYTILQDYYTLGVVLAELLTTENFQRKLNETLNQNPHSYVTDRQIKAMMPDVFQTEDLLSHRRTIASKNKQSASPKPRNGSREQIEDLEKRFKFRLIDLVYKLMAPSQPNNEHSSSSTSLSKSLSSNVFIEHRPTEDELNIQVAILVDLRDRLKEAKLKRQKSKHRARRGSNHTDDDLSMLPKSSSMRLESATRSVSQITLSYSSERPTTAISLSSSSTSTSASTSNSASLSPATSSSTVSRVADFQQQKDLIDALSSLLNDLTLSPTLVDTNALSARQKTRLSIFEQHLAAAKDEPTKASVYLDGACKLLENDPLLNLVHTRFQAISNRLIK